MRPKQISDWRDDLDEVQRSLLKRKSMPHWSAPMLATLTKDRFSSQEWIYERKLDGERCLAFRRRSRLHLLSRNKMDLNDTYPELVAALLDQAPQHFIVDGEIVAFEGGTTSFSRLQNRIGIKNPQEARNSDVKVSFYLFDLLYFEGYDITHLSLHARKVVLRRHFDFTDPLRFTIHRNKEGDAFYKQACDKGWEGLIAKRADSSYEHKRSSHWLKFKCVHQQELVIAGYTDPKGSRTGFGALLLGYYSKGSLQYAGKVGTGFNQQLLDSLGRKLKAREQQDCPYEKLPDDAGDDVHWVTPNLVAELGCTEWTRDGRLRHPRFLGLRRDKPVNKVVREVRG